MQLLVRTVSTDGQYQGLQLQENQGDPEDTDQTQDCLHFCVQRVQEERGPLGWGGLQMYGGSQHGLYQSDPGYSW